MKLGPDQRGIEGAALKMKMMMRLLVERPRRISAPLPRTDMCCIKSPNTNHNMKTRHGTEEMKRKAVNAGEKRIDESDKMIPPLQSVHVCFTALFSKTSMAVQNSAVFLRRLATVHPEPAGEEGRVGFGRLLQGQVSRMKCSSWATVRTPPPSRRQEIATQAHSPQLGGLTMHN
ncbi:hypothetical protein E2C01_012384 [Portunus trituberculatus]|uniref:Uncharacterized protein n=1 Tax=Portunus trituberculatus TaxID=210409 RepID=A0A5B7DE08_PORTR|nr:hypothetical protein [Portunus trituberculatus]